MLIKDQLNRLLKIKNRPNKIISLVPSISSSLYDIGLDNEVVGITHFCKFPKHWKKSKTIIGGTKDLKIDRIAKLKPDLIFASKEENTEKDVLELQKIAPVYVSDVNDFKTNQTFLEDLGIIFDKKNIVEKIIKNINEKENLLNKNKQSYKSIYLIWKEPYMTIGWDTFINYMMQKAGFMNLYNDKKRYPATSIDEMKSLNPEIIFLSSEPYPFKEKHIKEFQNIFPNSLILNVEGEAFTWFGTYQQKGLEYLIDLKAKIRCTQNKKN